MNSAAQAGQGFLHNRPMVGLMALTLGVLGQWFRHVIFPLTEAAFGDSYLLALLVIGLVGAILVWVGLKQDEIAGTWKGYLGGLFIWVGWFEYGFHFFADAFGVAPYQATERLVSSPDLNMVQASFPIFVSIFLIFGLFNRESRCNMMRWVHRNLRVDPGRPTPGYQRSFARVTALETVFVIWFCYAIWLLITYFGKSMALMAIAFLLWTLWFVYLVWRLLKIERPGYAFRYGIAVGIIGWVLLATPSHMGLFPVIWLLPFDYPISTATATLVFVMAIWLFSRTANDA